MKPSKYDITTNQNYWVVKELWSQRHDEVTRMKIRNCLTWIRLDIIEFNRWNKR